VRAPVVAVLVTVVALLSTVFLPFVNRPTLWFGLPSVMVWTVLWVLALSAALAWVEFGRRHADDEQDWSALVEDAPAAEELGVHR
jgi:protein-S-isoprenylcysteine O-methyltransferase Ste14